LVHHSHLKAIMTELMDISLQAVPGSLSIPEEMSYKVYIKNVAGVCTVKLTGGSKMYMDMKVPVVKLKFDDENVLHSSNGMIKTKTNDVNGNIASFESIQLGGVHLCKVVHVHSRKMCLNLLSNLTHLKNLQMSVSTFCSSPQKSSFSRSLSMPTTGAIVGVKHDILNCSEHWHRAEVLTLLNGQHVGLLLIDSGPTVMKTLDEVIDLLNLFFISMIVLDI